MTDRPLPFRSTRPYLCAQIMRVLALRPKLAEGD